MVLLSLTQSSRHYFLPKIKSSPDGAQAWFITKQEHAPLPACATHQLTTNISRPDQNHFQHSLSSISGFVHPKRIGECNHLQNTSNISSLIIIKERYHESHT